MNSGWKELIEARKMQHVNRLSARRLTRKYSLAEHSFYVTQIFSYLCNQEKTSYSTLHLETVMMHDMMETQTGDLLWPAKNLNELTSKSWDTIEKEVAEKMGWEEYTDSSMKMVLGPELFKIFKASDYLELYMFVLEEMALGNKSQDICVVHANCRKLIPALGVPSATRVMEALGIDDF